MESAISEEATSLEDIRPTEGGELTLAFRPFAEVPESLAKRYGPFVYTLNLTDTGIRSLETLRYFTHLKTLILDNNALDRLGDCPKLDSVTTLWFNNNQVSDLPCFMDEVIKCFPKLAYLSMMRNPAAPGLMDLIKPDLKACKMYRLYTLYRMPGLQVLDSTTVSEEERSEARARGHFAVKRRPANAPPPPQQPASGLFWPSGASVAAMAGPRDSAPPHEDPFAASAHHHNAKLSQKQSSAYLGVVRRKYDGRHSEGNRFIIDSQL